MHAKALIYNPSLDRSLMPLKRDENGQGMVEYVLILMLVALALIGSFPPLANRLIGLFGLIGAAFKHGNV
jgi:Flp pilus assembly pilin Flp